MFWKLKFETSWRYLLSSYSFPLLRKLNKSRLTKKVETAKSIIFHLINLSARLARVPRLGACGFAFTTNLLSSRLIFFSWRHSPFPLGNLDRSLCFAFVDNSISCPGFRARQLRSINMFMLIYCETLCDWLGDMVIYI